MVKRKVGYATLAIALMVGTQIKIKTASAAINVVPFAPSVFDANTANMDAALGITGFDIEDFEDTTLISGLSYTFGSPNNGTFAALPGLLNGTTVSGVSPNLFWDQVNVLVNTADNTIGNRGDGSRSDVVTFNIAGGATSFGVGLINFQGLGNPPSQFPITNHDFFVNGVNFGLLENLTGWAFVFDRNLYLKIDATDGDVINSVSFRNLDGTNIDILGFDHLAVQFIPATIQVGIDIKPGSDPNSINLGSNGVIPVAILSSAEFDATQVDPESVLLAGAGVAVKGKGNKLLASVEDVNNDGLNDLVLKVETENLVPEVQSGSAILTGSTFGGQAIEGSDVIIVVPPE